MFGVAKAINLKCCHTNNFSYHNTPIWKQFWKLNLANLTAMFAAILNSMPSKTVLHKWKTTVKFSEYSGYLLTSKYIKIFAKSIYYTTFGGHLGRRLECLKTLNGAKPAHTGILKSNVSPLRKYRSIYYTLPCHVRLTYIKYLPDYNVFCHG